MKNYQKTNIEFFGIFLIFLFALFSAFQIFGKSIDYYGYYNIFCIPYKSFTRLDTEPFFLFLRAINDVFFASTLFPIYLVSAIIALSLKWKAIKNLSITNTVLVFLWEILCFFWIQEYTQIRAACAIGIFLLSLNDIISCQYKKYILKACVATLFHYSAITMFVFLVFVLLFKTKKAVMLLPILGFVFAILASKLLGEKLRSVIYFIEHASGLNKSGNVSNFMSPFNLKYFMLLCGFICCTLFVDENDTINFTLCKAVSFGLSIYYWLNPADLPVIAVRLAEFFTSAFVPCFFNCVRYIPIKEKKILKIFPQLCFMLYSYASIKTAILQNNF